MLKKKSEFAVRLKQDIEDIVWVVESDYALYFLIVSIYHLPFLSGFGFCIYCLIHHPRDWQNASVQSSTTIAFMANPLGAT